ncbi:PREDICTED: beta-carotene isomerase D27, chloroplastic isoform X2 [Populus euphratica]|uniref:Beta-carotene isomerase D27, chloroplastic isoform X2 n=1 Tax=Populus euphratica TaxID=75702 RepID=A0AAJ6V709_POPEU|nr:PREDICTED: beta-carotene isomerase D27, chloroplastic isoform X2 [Populus euphratica]
MKAVALLRPLYIPSFPSRPHVYCLPKRTNLHVSCSSQRTESPVKAEDSTFPRSEEYRYQFYDDWFLALFRNKMVKEVGWDSEKAGYDGLIEVASRLMLRRTPSDTTDAAVRILRSLFPPFLLHLYKSLVSPIGGGKLAAIMVGELGVTFHFCFSSRVTVITCQWLMGICKVNSVDLPDGSSWESGVFVERCKYLEESKCVGICVNTCKLPTQTFFKDYMGIPLLMEPNFNDYSCQFKFGVLPPLPEDDGTLKEPCLEACPIASKRRGAAADMVIMRCPKSRDISAFPCLQSNKP